jgi:hypothetical protein
LVSGRTVVLVTHRAGPIALADRIVPLTDVGNPTEGGAADPTPATTAVNPW